MTKILLHACCGPCSIEPVRLLAEAGHDITIAYMNSNIQPKSEYDHRLATLLTWAREQGIPVIEGEYHADAWAHTAGIVQAQDGPREDRCRACYRMRLEEACQYAKEHGFGAVSTTLAVSPYQYFEVIEQELHRAADAYGLDVIYQDFRPYYPNATQKSRDLGMYRQNYCGCAISKVEADTERIERKQKHQKEVAERQKVRDAQAAKRKKQRAAYDAKQHAKKAARNAYRAKMRELAQAGVAATTKAGIAAETKAAVGVGVGVTTKARAEAIVGVSAAKSEIQAEATFSRHA